MKWLLKKNFPYNEYVKRILIKNKIKIDKNKTHYYIDGVICDEIN